MPIKNIRHLPYIKALLLSILDSNDHDFNIDHIVVGPDAVYAFETKAKSKPRAKRKGQNQKVISDGKTIQFPDHSSSDFINQAKRQAKSLKNWLSNAVGATIKVAPVVLLPGWYVERTKMQGY